MSPERANVFIAEDHKHFADIIEYFLKEVGHSVVLKAPTLEAALASIDRFEELGVNVAVLDGNLNEEEIDGYDGQEVLEAIRKKFPHVKTVGMSGNSVPGTDLDLGKSNVKKVGDVVSKL